MSIEKVPICPVVSHRFLDDPPDEGGTDPFVVGDLTTGELAKYVKAKVYARVCQSPSGPEDDDTPASKVIDADEPFAIDIYWRLIGSLVPAFCGNWAAKISFESMGPDEWDLEIVTPDNCQIPFGCAEVGQNRNTRIYHARYTVPANKVKTEDDGTAYELNVSLVLLSPCDKKPLELIGFVPLEDIMFYSS
jgi:hypothetical protein